MFKKIIILLLIFFGSTSVSFGQVQIRKSDRILNEEPGYCAWCCLETLGRHYKIESLYGLKSKRSKEFTWEYDQVKQEWYKSPYVWVDYGEYKMREHRSPATPRALSNKLNSLKVKYHYQSFNNYDTTVIKNAVKNKKGCLVIVKWWLDSKGKPVVPSNNSTHAIIVLDYNTDGVEFLDPNDIENTYTATHDWFNTYWTGYVLVIDK